MKHRFSALISVIALTLFACAGPLDDALEVDPPESSSVVYQDEKGDLMEIRVRASGMTLWMRPYLQVTDEMEDGWRILGRTSRNLVNVETSFGQARVLSPRRFEVVLNHDAMQFILRGEYLELTFEPTNGGEYRAGINLRGRVTEGPVGSSRVYPWRNILPVVMDGVPVMRGRATVNIETLEFQVHQEFVEDAPVVRRQDERRFTMDWSLMGLLRTARSSELARLSAHSANGPIYNQQVDVTLAIHRVELTNDPSNRFRATCAQSTYECLQSLPDGDTESCGETRDVYFCDRVDQPLNNTFVTRVRVSLAQFYRDHGDEIRENGGLNFLDSRLEVQPDRVEYVSSAQSPYDFDDEQVRVVRHPDPVFLGSGAYWYGAYDRYSLDLLALDYIR